MKKVILGALILAALSSHVYAEDYAAMGTKALEGAMKGAIGGAAKAVGATGTSTTVRNTEIKNKSTVMEAALISSNAGVKVSGDTIVMENSKIDNESFINKAVLYNSNAGVQIGD